MLYLRLAPLVTAAAIACLGCTTETTGGLFASSGACTKAAVARCTKLRECDGMFFQMLYRDEADCTSRVSGQCMKSVAAPDARTTMDEAAACAKAITSASCDQFLEGSIACSTSPGTRPRGAPCGTWSQCAAASCSFSYSSSETCGRCSTDSSQDGTCATSGDCDDDLSCKRGSCQPTRRLGSACSYSRECPGYLVCVQGACSKMFPPPDGMTAVLAGSGEDCGTRQDDPGVVAFCKAGLECEDGRCVPDVKVGATCSTSTASCEAGSFCIQGTCRVPDPAVCKDDGSRKPMGGSGGSGGGGSCTGNCNCTCSGGRYLTGLVGGACTCNQACQRTGNGSSGTGSCS